MIKDLLYVSLFALHESKGGHRAAIMKVGTLGLESDGFVSLCMNEHEQTLNMEKDFILYALGHKDRPQ